MKIRRCLRELFKIEKLNERIREKYGFDKVSKKRICEIVTDNRICKTLRET